MKLIGVNNTMIKVIATFNFKAGNIAKVKTLCAELIEATRKEAGCIQYDLLQSDKDENVMAFVENWESQEALDVHSASEHFTRIVPQLAGLCTEPPAVETFRQIF